MSLWGMLLWQRKAGPGPVRPEAERREQARKAAQEWLPCRDVAGGVIVRRDGWLVAVLRVEPLNLALKSEAEQKRVIGAVFEALNGLREPVQVLSLGRPVDLDAYLAALNRMAADAPDPRRKRLLRDYVRYVAGLAATGEALERRFYLLLPQAPGVHAREDVLQRAGELAGCLEAAGLRAGLCGDREIIDLLFCFLQPAQAAYERPPERSGPELPARVG